MRHASALKAKRQNIARRSTNSQIRSRVRNLTRAVEKAISEKNVELAKSNFKIAQSEWRKAAKRNIFHANSASRHISRMATHVAALAKS